VPVAPVASLFTVIWSRRASRRQRARELVQVLELVQLELAAQRLQLADRLFLRASCDALVN
jgi:hypothetical protein